MKQFLTIFKFEFLGVVRKKAYIITTALFVLVIVIGLLIPTILGGVNTGDSASSEVEQSEDKATYVVYDADHLMDVKDKTMTTFFPNATFKNVNSQDELEKQVMDKKADGGFIINKDYSFTYYVFDSSLYDTNNPIFAEALSQVKRNAAFEAVGYDASEIMNIYYQNTSVGKTVTLGSDGANNIIYTTMLIMVIYMVTILYGSITATSVATEKGNRTMELLVTSANTNALIFGKVLASALAAIIQVGLLVGSAALTYQFAKDAWNGMLDMVFNIPASVLSAFAIFGIVGFLFYSFIFGALGALVSKSEEVNSAVTPVTLIFVAIYIVVYTGIMDPTGIVFKVASFVPLSSPMAMFARMAMVDVPLFEVLLSLALLLLSMIAVGYASAKIYRRGTLMYGNQVKLVHALKWLKKGND